MLNEIVIDENNIGFVPSLGISFEFSETGKDIINYLKEDKTKEEIVQALSEKYGVEWRQVYIDVEDFFLKLKVYGLIQ